MGIREIQDFERGSLAAAPVHPPTSSAADFCLVFDLQSLEIQIMSDGMKQLCKSLHPSNSMPDALKQWGSALALAFWFPGEKDVKGHGRFCTPTPQIPEVPMV